MPTVAAFEATFIREGRSEGNTAGYVREKRRVMKTHIIPFFGQMRLDEIVHADVVAFRITLDGLSKKSKNNILSVLRKMLECARENGFLKSVFEIKNLKTPKPLIDTYAVEDYVRLAHTAKQMRPEALAVILLGGDEGLRRGEMAALRWDAIDFVKSEIIISKAVSGKEISAPKNGQARRVPMSDAVAVAMRAIPKTSEWVFAGRFKGHVSPNTLYKWVARLLTHAGIKQARSLHSLRHFFCDRLSSLGAPVNTIRELAGHGSIAMTQKYLHPGEAEKVRAISLINKENEAPRSENPGASITGQIDPVENQANPGSTMLSGRQDLNLPPSSAYRTLTLEMQQALSCSLPVNLALLRVDNGEAKEANGGGKVEVNQHFSANPGVGQKPGVGKGAKKKAR